MTDDPVDTSRADGPPADRAAADRAGADSAGADRAGADGAATDKPDGGVPATTDAEAAQIGVRRGMFGQADTGDTSGYGGLVRSITMPTPAQRPYGGAFDEVADALATALDADSDGFERGVEKVVVDRGELTMHVRRDRIVQVCRALRDEPDLRFELCSGVSGVHYPDEAGRELHAVYHLLSITHNRRLRLEVACPDEDPHIPSVVEVYPTADWHERETWDFFGIQFDGHPALTRIQMPDDWPGHPQRKDYPLGGIPVEYKGATIPPPDTRRSYS